jgi:hypothetical protein
MRRRFIAVGALGVTALVIVAIGVGAAAATSKRQPTELSVVTMDDGSKELWTYDAFLDVPMDGVTVPVGTPVPEGKRLVIETISVRGNGEGPVTDDQGIERVELGVLGSWTIAIPLDRYSWGSCPGFEPPENCGNYNRFWKYAGTAPVRAYVDSSGQIEASAQHPGGGNQQLYVQVIGFLVPVPAS